MERGRGLKAGEFTCELQLEGKLSVWMRGRLCAALRRFCSSCFLLVQTGSDTSASDVHAASARAWHSESTCTACMDKTGITSVGGGQQVPQCCKPERRMFGQLGGQVQNHAPSHTQRKYLKLKSFPFKEGSPLPPQQHCPPPPPVGGRKEWGGSKLFNSKSVYSKCSLLFFNDDQTGPTNRTEGPDQGRASAQQHSCRFTCHPEGGATPMLELLESPL